MLTASALLRNAAVSSQYLSVLYAVQRQKSKQIDYSRFPKLNEDELEESFTRGSGPGGQAVNKTSNCVLLRHIPTNLLVKCHTHRLASKNRIEARKLLLEKLDVHLNGELAVSAQMRANEQRKGAEKKRRQQKLQELKRSWKEREGLSETNTTNKND